MSPFLSICVMTYNRSGTLRETLDSVLPQLASIPDVEVLVSDNASTDDTEAVVREYCGHHPRLRYSRNVENVGFDGNVVACVEKAAGEYMAFLSDDDLAPAGLVEKLRQLLMETRPVAAYINHTPFFHDNPAEISAPTQPVLRKEFTNPREFFLYCGLGFISALSLKTELARKYVEKAVRGRGTAHVDIAARTVLASEGPFVFDGTLTVLARNAYDSGYDPLRFGAMNTTVVHQELLAEGLLTQDDLDWQKRKTIRLFLQRHIVTNRLKGRKALVSAKELREMYGSDPLFYVYAYPLALIPPTLLRWMALPARALMRMRRRWMFTRGNPGAAPPHIAPPA